jgi:hypothetical protein
MAAAPVEARVSARPFSEVNDDGRDYGRDGIERPRRRGGIETLVG